MTIGEFYEVRYRYKPLEFWLVRAVILRCSTVNDGATLLGGDTKLGSSTVKRWGCTKANMVPPVFIISNWLAMFAEFVESPCFLLFWPFWLGPWPSFPPPGVKQSGDLWPSLLQLKHLGLHFFPFLLSLPFNFGLLLVYAAKASPALVSAYRVTWWWASHKNIVITSSAVVFPLLRVSAVSMVWTIAW